MLSNHKYIAFETIVIKEIRRFTRIWLQTLLPPAVTIGLYFMIFGNLIGRRIGQMGGYDYMDFIVPGLIMMAIINNSYSNVVSSFYSAKFNKSIEELQVSPTPNWVILVGYVCGGVLRGLVNAGASELVKPIHALFGGLYFPIPPALEKYLVPMPDRDIRIEVRTEWVDFGSSRIWQPRDVGDGEESSAH